MYLCVRLGDKQTAARVGGSGEREKTGRRQTKQDLWRRLAPNKNSISCLSLHIFFPKKLIYFPEQSGK